MSAERRALWLVKAYLGDASDFPDDDSGMRQLVHAVDVALRGEPVSYRKALHLPWEAVYHGLVRKGYDPAYAQYRADTWAARRKREGRRTLARGHGAPAGWLTLREAGAVLGLSQTGVSKALKRGALRDLKRETVMAYKEGR